MHKRAAVRACEGMIWRRFRNRRCATSEPAMRNGSCAAVAEGDSSAGATGVLMVVDGATAALAALNLGWFTTVSQFLDSYTYILFLAIAFLLYLAYPRVRANRLKIVAFVIGLVIAGVLALGLKEMYAQPRPCAELLGDLKLASCPTDYSFPSGHTTFAFVFAGASLGTSFFPLFILLSILVAMSRIYLGIHTLNDVAGGMVIALSVYFAVETCLRNLFPQLIPRKERELLPKVQLAVEKVEWKSGFAFEVRRRVAHVTFGTIIIALIYFLGRAKTELLLMMALFTGMTFMHLRMERKRALLIDELFELLERPMVMPAKGAFMYVIGALLALAFLGDIDKVLAVIAILAFGDGAATLAGKLVSSGPRLPHNPEKTLAGAAAFFAFGSAAAYPFVGVVAFPVTLICAMVETLDLKIDDNLLVPLAATIIFSFI